MSEVTDVVLPVLQKIQAEISSMRASLNEVRVTQVEQSEKLDDLSRYFTVMFGYVSRHEIDVDEIRKRLKAVEAKLSPPPAAV
ncbi:hypothetical protein [Prosthecodimorpha staleyi]|uniref:Uncharacterized protein n=1 Tax=Prosthecodimorpha staleyi TaxID=2840188 RepID=A0A947GCI9_9HYPH|nr:hypothetical protein [Prosthecodimorpha staleyi]MBT9291468.1 hypothetical protein [Prosthecodimorpha staleyi]